MPELPRHDETWGDLDMNTLAQVVFDPAQPQAIIDAVWVHLAPQIKAQQAAVLERHFRGIQGGDRQMLIDAAPTEAFMAATRKLKRDGEPPAYDRTRPFRPWCKQILYRRAVDYLRRMKPKGQSPPQRENERVIEDEDVDAGQWLSRLFARMSAEAPLSGADLREIQSWHPRTQLVLLLYSGLWVKVPIQHLTEAFKRQARRWVTELEESLQWLERLTPQELADATQRVLENKLGLKLGEVANQKRRHLWRLFQLAVVGEVIEFPAAGPSFFDHLLRQARGVFHCFDGAAPVPFSSHEQTKLGNKHWKRRLLFLTLAGLWPRVPAELWRSWCLTNGVTEPFPPRELDVDQSPDANVLRIQPALRDDETRLLTAWTEGRPKFLKLPSIQELVRIRSCSP